MAWSGWSLNATPTFRGLSYDEWAKPLQQATDFHKELETQYGELDAKASMWDKLANDALGKDSKAYKQYKAYADDLRSQADDLAKNGLGYNSRRNLLNMVGRYSSEITPIEEAWKKREALAKEQNELLAKNPDMLTNRYAGKESIDFFMDNPEWSYNTLNMKDRYEKVWKQAGAFKEQLLRNVGQISESNVGNGKSVAENLKWVKSSVPATYERIKAYGNDTKSLAEALNNPNSDLNKMLEAELLSTGMEDWEFAYSYDKDKSTANRRGYEDARNRFMNFMGGATLNTLGKTEFEHLTDNVYLENIKYAHQKALQDERLAAATPKEKPSQVSHPYQVGNGSVQGNGDRNDEHKRIITWNNVYNKSNLDKDSKEIMSHMTTDEIDKMFKTLDIQYNTRLTPVDLAGIKDYVNNKDNVMYVDLKTKEFSQRRPTGSNGKNGYADLGASMNNDFDPKYAEERRKIALQEHEGKSFLNTSYKSYNDEFGKNYDDQVGMSKDEWIANSAGEMLDYSAVHNNTYTFNMTFSDDDRRKLSQQLDLLGDKKLDKTDSKGITQTGIMGGNKTLSSSDASKYISNTKDYKIEANYSQGMNGMRPVITVKKKDSGEVVETFTVPLATMGNKEVIEEFIGARQDDYSENSVYHNVARISRKAPSQLSREDYDYLYEIPSLRIEGKTMVVDGKRVPAVMTGKTLRAVADNVENNIMNETPQYYQESYTGTGKYTNEHKDYENIDHSPIDDNYDDYELID